MGVGQSYGGAGQNTHADSFTDNFVYLGVNFPVTYSTLIPNPGVDNLVWAFCQSNTVKWPGMPEMELKQTYFFYV